MTAGYRAFTRELLESIDFDDLSKAGYIFQVDLAFRAVKDGWDVREVPITFTEREYGESKLDGSFVKDSLFEVTKWGIAHRSEQAKDLAGEVSNIASYTYRHSSLPGLAGKLKEGFAWTGDFADEVQSLLKHQFGSKSK